MAGTGGLQRGILIVWVLTIQGFLSFLKGVCGRWGGQVLMMAIEIVL